MKTRNGDGRLAEAVPIITDLDISRLRGALRNYTPVPNEEFNKLLCHVRQYTIRKGGFLVRAGEIRSCVDFIVSGVIRCFQFEESGLEYTKHFFTEGDFVVTDRRFLFGDARGREDAGCYFEALEDSKILTVSTAAFESCLVHPCWKQGFLNGIDVTQELERRRIEQLLTADAETRYRFFALEYPGLEKRIRQHHIASYLGISPVSLSRIRSKHESH